MFNHISLFSQFMIGETASVGYFLCLGGRKITNYDMKRDFRLCHITFHFISFHFIERSTDPKQLQSLGYRTCPEYTSNT